MEYLLLITSDESADEALSPQEAEERFQRYMAFGAEMEARGVLRGGNRLCSTSDATTVRVRDGETLTTDGPFAETKEQLGGYYLVDCADLDEAIEIASKIPAAHTTSVEVRPIFAM